jgi:hypothetical protein
VVFGDIIHHTRNYKFFVTHLDMDLSSLVGIVLFLLSVLVNARYSGARELLVTSFSASDKPVTVPFNATLQPGSEDLPFDDARVVKKVYSTAPEQVTFQSANSAGTATEQNHVLNATHSA